MSGMANPNNPSATDSRKPTWLGSRLRMLSRMGGNLTLVSPCPAAWRSPAAAAAAGQAPNGLLALIRLRAASDDRSPPAA